MYSKEQIEQAQSIDLLSYVENRGYALIRGSNEVRLKEHDSLVISNNKWNWFTRNKGGGTLDFLVIYENIPFKEAMKILLGEKEINKKVIQYSESNNKSQDKIITKLPVKNSNYRRIYAYLGKTRCIDYNIISDMVKSGLLYEDVYHNCVFLGKDSKGDVKYCLKVGTLTDKKYKGEIEGSDKSYSLEIINDPKCKIVCVYESIIDAMSHETLIKLKNKNYKKTNKISSSSLSSLKLDQYLIDHPDTEKIIFCLDNDKWGIKATKKFKEKYEELGYTVTAIIPKIGKDFNDELVELVTNQKKTLEDVKSSIQITQNSTESKEKSNKELAL